MSAILKDEEFSAIESPVKAGVAPQPVAAAFNVCKFPFGFGIKGSILLA